VSKTLRSVTRAWIVLWAGGALEVVWAAALRRAGGWSEPGWLAGALAVSVVSVAMLGWAMRRITLGAAYAAWIGIGTLGSFVTGIAVFGEPGGAGRLASVACIVIAMVGLRLTEPARDEYENEDDPR
jgi:quaternary ammonium compound-resistance protein SugE